MKRRRRGVLDDEDRALWNAFARSVRPLRPISAEPEAAEAASPPEKESLPAAMPSQPAPKLRARPAPAPAALDRRTARDLRRGASAIEARLDLHGLGQAQAHARLVSFLHAAQARGLKTVLVITGKGGREADLFTPGERGILRRMAPQWLAMPDLRALVLGFEPAGPAHGGGGAFYVRLRRSRKLTG